MKKVELIIVMGTDQVATINSILDDLFNEDLVIEYKRTPEPRGMKYTIQFVSVYAAYLFGHTQGSFNALKMSI